MPSLSSAPLVRLEGHAHDGLGQAATGLQGASARLPGLRSSSAGMVHVGSQGSDQPHAGYSASSPPHGLALPANAAQVRLSVQQASRGTFPCSTGPPAAGHVTPLGNRENSQLLPGVRPQQTGLGTDQGLVNESSVSTSLWAALLMPHGMEDVEPQAH